MCGSAKEAGHEAMPFISAANRAKTWLWVLTVPAQLRTGKKKIYHRCDSTNDKGSIYTRQQALNLHTK